MGLHVSLFALRSPRLMYELSRRVRFGVSPAQLHGGDGPAGDEPAGLGAFYELEVRCRGRPDSATGYVMNISEIDEAVRDRAVDRLREAMAGWVAGSDRPAGTVLAAVLETLQPALGHAVSAVRWWLSPYHSILCEADHMDRVLISRQFEFSAAHRLHSSALSPDENRSVFGKCNNPSGHGHNYKLEPLVSVPLEGASFGFPQLATLVDEHVIRRFDHKHLNLDTAEFTGLNPTVEHIARICHEVLEGPIAEAGGLLRQVTVWETDKTACTYPAGG